MSIRLLDSYDAARVNSAPLATNYYSQWSQSFTNINEVTLDSCKFYLSKNPYYGAYATGTAYAKIYTHSGTYGSSSKPTGSALATSDGLDVSTVSAMTTFTLTTFNFTGANRIILNVNTYYVLSIEYAGSGNYKTVEVAYGASGEAHSGNASGYIGGSLNVYGNDTLFYVYGSSEVSSSPSVSPSFSLSISPSLSPSISPSLSPSFSPSFSPSSSPSISPSVSPSISPSLSSSFSPSLSPSLSPSVSSSVSPSIEDPENIYTDDANYASARSSNGVLGIQLSKDAGATWHNILEKTFAAGETTETYGNGSQEKWGTSWVGENMTDTNFRVRMIVTQIGAKVNYKTFGFTVASGPVLTGIEVKVKAYWNGTRLYINHIQVKIYYGISSLPVQAGSQTYASNGIRVTGGTGVLVFFDGYNWIATDSGSAVIGTSTSSSMSPSMSPPNSFSPSTSPSQSLSPSVSPSKSPSLSPSISPSPSGA